MYTVWWEK